MKETILNGDIVELLTRARVMDECCNLVGHSLKYFELTNIS
jgi:hypothetical protein